MFLWLHHSTLHVLKSNKVDRDGPCGTIIHANIIVFMMLCAFIKYARFLDMQLVIHRVLSHFIARPLSHINRVLNRRLCSLGGTHPADLLTRFVWQQQCSLRDQDGPLKTLVFNDVGNYNDVVSSPERKWRQVHSWPFIVKLNAPWWQH
jgi:hypothetical protein